MTSDSTRTISAGRPEAATAGAAPRVLAVLGFAALTAASAKIAVPLPGTVVPFTFQVAAVLLAGLVLGSGLGAASQLAYLAAGLAGLPVFAAGGGAAYLLGPTGGYLLAFPLAAAVAGLGAGRSGLLARFGLCLLAIAVIHAGGAGWLALVAGAEAARAALRPFLLSDLLQTALVLLIASRLSPLARRLSS